MNDLGKHVVYQIYPKSFQDSNSDGFGDLPGVVERLDYLQELGVDFLWLTPFFTSPQNDNGYDIADYRRIDPRYGTMEDFDRLVQEAGSRGISLMLDMVFNHTSSHHIWFQKALEGDSRYKDFYIFKKGSNGGPPTNWVSKFGGSAWEYVPQLDEYYLHLFHVTQPDLNWENPAVREEVYAIINFWIEKGVKGFRFDVINLISKPEHYENDSVGDGRRFYTDGPKIHQFLKDMRTHSFGQHPDIVTVGEMSSTSLENCIRYSSPGEKELSMTFSFHHLKVDYPGGNKWALEPFRFFDLKNLLNTWQVEMEKQNGWNAVFWCNHDQPRIVSRLGDDKRYRKESAKMLATAIHCLRGTPYIYQGEEIGMTNAGFTDIKQYRDVESLNYFQILKEQGTPEEEIYQILSARSRDNSRTPMQWDASENAGFTAGVPWLEVNANHTAVNTADRKDSDSIFHYYQSLIHLRKELNVISAGSFRPLLESHDKVFAYLRELDGEKLLVLCNFYPEEAFINLEESRWYLNILSNYPKQDYHNAMTLRPYETCVFYGGNK